MSSLIISVSGLRGIIGETLDPAVAMDYARAFAAELPAGPIIVARDGRQSGPMLVAAVQAALMGCGRRVLDAQVAATPTVGVLVRSQQAAGAMQISASHNPPAYNGIKLFGGDGRVLSADVGARIAQRYREASLARWCSTDELGQSMKIDDTVSDHLQLVLRTVDVARIRRHQFRVLLDANHGSGAVLGEKLLAALGCQVTVLGAESHGRFAHPPEPTAENLAAVGQHVVACRADVGFCQDPDADRLALLDEAGRYIGEEYTLAICLHHRLQHEPGPVVVNCATSRMSEDVAQQHGVVLHRSAVGEANVADRMLAVNAVYGGEGNGGPIDPRVGYVRDSFVGMAQVLDAMARGQQTVSQLAAQLPRYAIEKTKVDLPASQVAAACAALERSFQDAATDRQDGLRLEWPDKWLLVRGSNTEPIVRIIAEAPTIDAAQRLCEQAARVLRESSE